MAPELHQQKEPWQGHIVGQVLSREFFQKLPLDNLLSDPLERLLFRGPQVRRRVLNTQERQHGLDGKFDAFLGRPAWSSRLLRPLFLRCETAVQGTIRPTSTAGSRSTARERAPDVQPDAPLVPAPQPPPTREGCGYFFGKSCQLRRRGEFTESLPGHDGSRSADGHRGAAGFENKGAIFTS